MPVYLISVGMIGAGLGSGFISYLQKLMSILEMFTVDFILAKIYIRDKEVDIGCVPSIIYPLVLWSLILQVP